MFVKIFILQGWEGVTFHKVLQGQSEYIKATHGLNDVTNQSINMSRSPERMSSYRRHFEGTFATPSNYSPSMFSRSPTCKETHHRSTSFTQSEGMMGHKVVSSRAGMGR